MILRFYLLFVHVLRWGVQIVYSFFPQQIVSLLLRALWVLGVFWTVSCIRCVFANIFSHSVSCLLILLIPSFAEEKAFNYNEVELISISPMNFVSDISKRLSSYSKPSTFLLCYHLKVCRFAFSICLCFI